ncbi:hypothetical protein [Thioalkalivibrio sp. XN8]|uniref:anti-sigma factor family protein n=1 Tax=Thioalkalivibrio sp. XN8 TaxID=2712863 RepID=UPI0013EE338A|nr:hypothetical protein [Thioalkalivibrio sp. XN8]NGP53916.1 hypothetical protein [Thioalkalivibrio sp. XN8]
MHATTEQLLSLRDGEAVPAEVQDHVAGCRECQQSLTETLGVRAGLRELPPLEPPRDLWATIAVDALPATARGTSWWPMAGGLAAGFALGLALILNLGGPADDQPAPGTTTDLVAATPAPASSVRGASQAELVATSQQLEAALRALPAAPRVTRTSTAYTIDELQRSIGEVDLMLSEPALDTASERDLWARRVDLMNTLMQVRYAELQDGY